LVFGFFFKFFLRKLGAILKTLLNLNQIFNNKQSLKMKKVLGLLVVATMVAFTACTKTAETTEEVATEAVEEVAADAEATIDSTVAAADSTIEAVKEEVKN
jgi:hypothetical protein